MSTKLDERPAVDTLGDALPREITRVRDVLIPAYLECGAVGLFAVTMMRQQLDDASKAMIEGDVVGMLRVYKALKEWKI